MQQYASFTWTEESLSCTAGCGLLRLHPAPLMSSCNQPIKDKVQNSTRRQAFATHVPEFYSHPHQSPMGGAGPSCSQQLPCVCIHVACTPATSDLHPFEPQLNRIAKNPAVELPVWAFAGSADGGVFPPGSVVQVLSGIDRQQLIRHPCSIAYVARSVCR